MTPLASATRPMRLCDVVAVYTVEVAWCRSSFGSGHTQEVLSVDWLWMLVLSTSTNSMEIIYSGCVCCAFGLGSTQLHAMLIQTTYVSLSLVLHLTAAAIQL